ncbi:MAG TPA: hypothetical protein PLY87_05520 [Planctomycetaceae bacterium]|nr:hypothetical protein [Planctomycetaceae bacterium]
MRKFCGVTWRAVGVSPPSYPHLTRRAYAAPLAEFAATGDVTPLIVNPAILLFNLCMGAYSRPISERTVDQIPGCGISRAFRLPAPFWNYHPCIKN